MKRIIGLILPLLLLGAVTTGCSSDDSASATLDGRTFTADSIEVDGTATPTAEGSQIELTFTEDGISVIAGCNTQFGMATWADGTLSVPPASLASTMMACSDALMAQDQQLAAFFGESPSYTLDGATLTLSTPTTVIVMTEK